MSCYNIITNNIYIPISFIISVTIAITASKQTAPVSIQRQGGDMVTVPAKGELKIITTLLCTVCTMS